MDSHDLYGPYPAQIYTVTDDVRGKVELVIRAEQPEKIGMRCVMKTHLIALLYLKGNLKI